MTRDYQSRGYIGGAPITSTISGSIGTGDPTFAFNTGGGTGFPTTNFWAVLDPDNASAEKVLIGSRSGDNCTGVVRGVDGTTAKAHTNCKIIHTGAAQDFTEANAIASALTTKGDSLWKGGTLSVAPARLAAGTDQQVVRFLAANALGVETTHKGSLPIFTTTGARDAAIAAPSAGQGNYQDTGDVAEGPWFYNGTNWRLPWNLPWGVVGTATGTTSQSGITTVTDLTSLSVTFTAVTGRRYRTLVFLPFVVQSTNAATVSVLIADGSNTQLQASAEKFGASDFRSLSASVVETISAGSVTRKARISASAASVGTTLGATTPAYILVEDVGPSGNPT